MKSAQQWKCFLELLFRINPFHFICRYGNVVFIALWYYWLVLGENFALNWWSATHSHSCVFAEPRWNLKRFCCLQMEKINFSLIVKHNWVDAAIAFEWKISEEKQTSFNYSFSECYKYSTRTHCSHCWWRAMAVTMHKWKRMWDTFGWSEKKTWPIPMWKIWAQVYTVHATHSCRKFR